MEEHFFSCPYCGARISLLIDTSMTQAKYIEDCETCCNPIHITYTTGNGIIETFDASSIEQ